MENNISKCISCTKGKSGFNFCSGLCYLTKEEALVKIKNREVQFFNDNHDVELFCFLSNSNSNLYKYYYTGENEVSSAPFDLPIVKISNIKNN